MNVQTEVAPEQIRQLVALGYEAESLECTYGDSFAGQYRWLLLKDASEDDPLVDFQDHDTSFDEDEPWSLALENAKLRGLIQ